MLHPLLVNTLHVFRDLYHAIKGLYTIVRYAISKDQIQLSLSLFSTESEVVKPGHNCSYAISICNISNQSAWVKLLFDIYLKENSPRLDGHYSYFEKAIFVRAHESQSVDIIYDWKDYVVIYIDDVSFKPDVFWSGDYESKGKYFVKALLLDEKGEAFDELTLVQSLSE